MQISENVVHQKTCKKCGIIYYGGDIDVLFLGENSKHIPFEKYKKRICNHCAQESRDEKKGKNLHSRWVVKARTTRRSHSKRLGIPEDVLERSYGWCPDIMAHEAAHQYENGCSECHKSYKEMNYGMGGGIITLDIRDRDLEPDYSSNTFWICASCNRAKGSMSMKNWTINKRLWRERPAKLVELFAIPKPVQPTLFNLP